MGGFVRSVVSAPQPVAPKPPKPEPKPIIETRKAIDPRYDDKKRRGRRSTILTSSEGVDESLEIAKKTLLGG
tara:strand:+ start:389 stop:604 length:216 start_codon:yes stop_codon:yes gene_type:complete